MATDQDTELPLDADSPNYTVSVVIENQLFTFHVTWNERDNFTDRGGSWYFDLLDENGDEDNPILSGVRITIGALLGRKSRDPRLPAGAFFVSDLSGKNQDPTINDLGTRVKVYFRPASAF